MLDTAITITIELLFAIVFVAAVVQWIRRRDVVSRDLVAVFGAVSALFVVQFVGLVFGSTPGWLAAISAALIFAQPLLTLRLASHLRPIPRAVMFAALAAYLATGIPLVLLPRPIPVAVTLLAIASFAITEFVAAAYLALEARRRVGPGRIRLGLAAGATALFATALLSAGAGAAGAGSVGAALARLVALLAALGYAAAFLPPAPLRRIWQGVTAFRYGSTFIAIDQASQGVGSERTWSRFAEAAREIAGAEAAVVVGVEQGKCRLIATNGLDLDLSDLKEALAGCDAELHAAGVGSSADAAVPGSRLARDLGQRIGAPLTSVIPLPPPGDRRLILLARHHSLFGAEDEAVLRLLASQAVSIAEREELAAEQRRLTERLLAASQAKSDFIASMSHELRTPLSAILGFSELMRGEPSTAEGRIVPDEWIEHVHRGGQHLLALINDVLDLAKVEAGRLDLEVVPFELSALVAETVGGVRPLADRKRVTITSDVEGIELVADRGRVRQILYNFLSNAIKFTPENGSIRVEATVKGDDIALSVTDSGVGIAPEDQAAVFEEFSQVGSQAGRSEGTGLGLALARRLAEAHGGRIELESEVGRGSRFTAVFPRILSVAGRPTETPKEPAPVARPARRSGDILVIEDDPSAAGLLRTYLEGDGYEVRVADDGHKGLAAARERRPAAIVLDVLLPGIDGWEVLGTLKEDPGLRDVPVIIVTVVDDRAPGLALGAVDYFLKPIDPAALLARLARYTFTTKVKTRPVNVLAIDDDPGALDMIEATLRPEGFQVARATNGRDGIDQARTEPYDLIVCDLVMPGMDGFEVVSALKADAATGEVPILILTAQTLSSVDKARLNGDILGIVEKGAEGALGLRRWLAQLEPQL